MMRTEKLVLLGVTLCRLSSTSLVTLAQQARRVDEAALKSAGKSGETG
jgi:hypothetical protein